MPTVLMCYPLQPYVEAMARITERPDTPLDERLVAAQKQLIDRYREQGFRVAWLCYSQPGSPQDTDRSNLMPGYGYQSDDAFLSSGITLATDLTATPAPTNFTLVLDQVGDTKGRLVIGGFFRDDWVDHLARTAYASDPTVRVDEELTERHFINRHVVPRQPVVRTPLDDFITRRYRGKLTARPWLATAS